MVSTRRVKRESEGADEEDTGDLPPPQLLGDTNVQTKCETPDTSDPREPSPVSSQTSTSTRTSSRGVFEMCNVELDDNVRKLKLNVTPVKVAKAQVTDPSLLSNLEEKVKLIAEGQVDSDIEEGAPPLSRSTSPPGEGRVSTSPQDQGGYKEPEDRHTDTPQDTITKPPAPTPSNTSPLILDTSPDKLEDVPPDDTAPEDTAPEDTAPVIDTTPPKMNPFLENVVASCKAKLGLDGKVYTLPSIEIYLCCSIYNDIINHC